MQQLISYIAPAAPATRRPAEGPLLFLRPEIGFTPKWYRSELGTDFGKKWHTDPYYRRESRLEMYELLSRKFPEYPVGRSTEKRTDILTGTFGTSAIAAIYGIPVRYDCEQWPVSEHRYLSADDCDKLKPPDLDRNSFFNGLMEQVQWIGSLEGRLTGFMNWQGVLNNARRLRGQDIFMDMYTAPERAKRIFDCVCTTMIDAALRLQREKSIYEDCSSFFTVSNCLVNLVNPELYEEFLMPFDQRISSAFGLIGIHNCAWNATHYLDHYKRVDDVGYIDMGIDSDMEKARLFFPASRRAIMYTPMDLACKPVGEIRRDMELIAAKYGPCDIVAADIEAGTSAQRIRDFIRICTEISDRHDHGS